MAKIKGLDQEKVINADLGIGCSYCINPKYWARHAWANSVDPSTLFVTYPVILDPSRGSKKDLFKAW